MSRVLCILTVVVLLDPATRLPAWPQQQKPAPSPGPSDVRSTIPATPWFHNEAIRREIQMEQQQYQRLNQEYSEARGRYQRGYDVLFSDRILSAEQRARKLRDLDAEFHKNLNDAAHRVITQPEQRQRYDQLWRQYRGYGAFADPLVLEKLRLTTDQRRRLQLLNDAWARDMVTLEASVRTDQDRDGGARRWEEMRKHRHEQINAVLTQDQQRIWRQMSGEPFAFEPPLNLQKTTETTPPKKEK